MNHDVSHALRGFTQRYVELWRQERDHAPASQALFGVPSPCIVGHRDDEVLWLTQPFTPAAALEKKWKLRWACGYSQMPSVSTRSSTRATYTLNSVCIA